MHRLHFTINIYVVFVVFQEYLESVNEQNVLRNLVSSEMNSKTAAYNNVNAVSDSANALYDSVITAKQMQDLDGE